MEDLMQEDMWVTWVAADTNISIGTAHITHELLGYHRL
jgi:hypothetical protein